MRTSEYITIGVLVGIVLLVGAFAWYQRSNSDNQEPFANLNEEERSFFATTYETFSGEVVSLEQFAGDVLVVNAWASWCPFCVSELPDLATLAVAYEDSEVSVVAVNRAEPPTTAISYLQSISVTNDSALHIWLDATDSFYKGIGGFAMPETVIYNRDGTVYHHKRGALNIGEIKMIVDEALAGE